MADPDDAFDLPDDIVHIDEYTENITMLLYGVPGIGKTRWLGTDKTLILATERGTISARKAAGEARVWKTNGWEQFHEAYEWLEANAGKEGFPFEWVAIDTGTELQNLIMRDIINADVEADEGRNPDKHELQEFGENQNRLMRYVGLINDLPINVCWTAHAMLATNEEGVEFRLPQFHGKGHMVASWVAAQMHLVGFMHFDEVTVNGKTKNVRAIQWRGTETIVAKDRFDCLGRRTIGKSMADIRKMITESATVDTAQ